MADYLALLKTIYTKELIETTDDIGLCIALTKSLSKDIENLDVLRDVVKYLFYVKPEHYFFLLFFYIPKKSYIPKLVKTAKVKDEKPDVLLDKLQYVLSWSNKELKRNKNILEKTVLQNKKYWKAELGVA
jgi:hypothetical protein